MDETTSPTETLEVVSTEPVALATESLDPALPDESLPETTVETLPETTPAVTEVNVTDPEELEGTSATIYEDLSGSEYEETVAATEEVVIVEVIESVGSDIAHASLFSGFLVCGTLVGIFMLRKIHGT